MNVAAVLLALVGRVLFSFVDPAIDESSGLVDLGSLVVGTDETAADGKQDDFSPTVTKAKASGATAFFYGGYYSNASKLVAASACSHA